MKYKTRKDIIFIITYVALIIFALVNFESILKFIQNIVNIFSPFLLGIILAFALNVLVNFIERKVFGKVKNGKFWSKIKSLSALPLVGFSYTNDSLYYELLIPQLKNSVSLLTESLPEYKEDIIDILNRFDVDEDNINKYQNI